VRRSEAFANFRTPVKHLSQTLRAGPLAEVLAGPVHSEPERQELPRHRRLAPAEIDGLAAEHSAGGATVRQLATRCGASRNIVAKHLKSCGLELGPQPLTRSEIFRVNRLADAGMSLNAIGREIRRDPKTVKAARAGTDSAQAASPASGRLPSSRPSSRNVQASFCLSISGRTTGKTRTGSDRLDVRPRRAEKVSRQQESDGRPVARIHHSYVGGMQVGETCPVLSDPVRKRGLPSRRLSDMGEDLRVGKVEGGRVETVDFPLNGGRNDAEELGRTAQKEG